MLKNFKKVLSLILVLTLLIPNFVFANELSEENQFNISEETMATIQEMIKDSEIKANRIEEPLAPDYNEDDTVRVIVELMEKPVIVHATESGQRYEDMSYSQKSNIESELYAAQEAVKNEISGKNIGMVFDSNFTTVFNGFSGQVKFREIEEIEAIRNVKKVYISNEYERPRIEPNMRSSNDMIESDLVWEHEDLGYKGEKTVVAIIDTGIDPSHKDFKLTDETLVKIKEEDLEGKGLRGEYHTAKVPYGYNYYDKNQIILDLGPDASEHGMHVAGTVTANGELKGVAPESQVLAMKVFSNDPIYATTFDDIYMVAIEESVILKADVLNMSLGATASFYVAESAIDIAITNATENGIVCSISAGNSAYVGDGAENIYGIGNPYKEDPDYGVVGSPSVTKDSISVASIENTHMSVKSLKYDLPGVAEVLPNNTIIIEEKAYDAATFNVDPEALEHFTTILNQNLDDLSKMPIYMKFAGETYIHALNTPIDKSILPKTVEYRYNDAEGNRVSKIVSVLPGGTTGDGETIITPMSPAGPYAFSDILEGQVEFVDCNIGAAEDFVGKDLQGKVALIIRGALNFTVKIENAEAAGAVGVIVYNHEDGGEDLINMQYPDNATIPAGFIGYKAGSDLQGLKDKMIEFPSEALSFPNVNAGKMSAFSSWGTTPTLEMKPEITAPGGMIYSTLQDNAYGTMSGTSMAAPHLSGGAALVMQYIKDKGLATELKDQTKLAKVLLMNTARPVIQDEISLVFPFEPAPYSPRLQGSGLMKLKSAVTTPVYVVDNSELGSKGEGKIELKDFDSTSVTFDLKAVNLTDKEVEYNIDVNAYRDAIHPAEIILLGSEKVDIEKSGDKKVTVPAEGSKEFTLTIDFSGDPEIYNNMFIEGWITLKDTKDEHPILNVPYVGFYGDWSQPRIIDQFDPTEDERPVYGMGGMISERTVDGETGWYFYGEKVIFTPGTDNGEENGNDHVVPIFSFLRNAEKVEYNILDENNRHLKTLRHERFARKNYSDGRRYPTYTLNPSRLWDGTVRDKIVEDGLYQYQIKAKIQASENYQEKKMPVWVDTTGPEITNLAYDEETGKLTWDATDEIAGILGFVIVVNEEPMGTVLPEEEMQKEFEFDLLAVKDKLTKEGDHKITVIGLDKVENESMDFIEIILDENIPYIYLIKPDLLVAYNTNEVEVEGYVLKNNKITTLKVNDVDADELKYSNNIKHEDTIKHEVTIVSGYTFKHTLTELEDGLHDVRIEAKSETGKPMNILRRFYVDTENPVFGEIKVLDRAPNSNTAEIEIEMSDNFPILNLYVFGSHEFSFDGADGALDIPNALETVSVTVDLDIGENRIPLKLIDAAGNEIENIVEIVREDAVDNNQAVELDKEALEIYYEGNDSSNHVTEDIRLTAMGVNRSFISWESSNDKVIKIEGNKAKVIQPVFDTEVTLTATITKGDASVTKDFLLTVKGNLKPFEGGIALGYGELVEDNTENYVAYVLFNLKEEVKEANYEITVKLDGSLLEKKAEVEGYEYRYEGAVDSNPESKQVIITINGIDFDVTKDVSFEEMAYPFTW